MSLNKVLNRISLRWRLTLLFTAVFGLAMMIYGFATSEFLRKSLEREFNDSLFNYAVDLTDGITLDPEGDLLVTPPQLDRAKIYPFYLGTALIQIRHKSGTVLSHVGDWGDLEVPYKLEFERLGKGEEAVYSTLQVPSKLPAKRSSSYRVIHFPIDNAVPPALVLQIAVPMTVLENQINNRNGAFQIGIPVILVFAIFASYLMAARALHPINLMVKEVRSIGAQELSRRIPEPTPRDEVRLLALTLNQMLTRIENAFQSQERFIADASHQLLTPLTIMKGVLEASGKNSLPPESVQSFLQEVDHLAQMVQNLLILARMDAGQESMTLSKIQFPEIVFQAIGKVEALARKKSTKIKFDLQSQEFEPPPVKGDESLLITLIFNLIENSLKYSAQGLPIEIKLTWNDKSQTLSIRDFGPGIPKGQEDEIFNRFRRMENSHIAQSPGFGLGLSIAKKITDAHSGKLWAENAPGKGAVFHIQLPHA